MAEILYPRDWDTYGPNPQLVLYEPDNEALFRIRVAVFDSKGILKAVDCTFRELRSKCGNVRLYSPADITETGSYVFSVYRHDSDELCCAVGAKVDIKNVVFKLDNALDSIKNIFLLSKSTKIIAMGVGKCGSSWLCCLLSYLPGFKSFDLAASGFGGLNYRELLDIPYGSVFHGHFIYESEVVNQIKSRNYLVAHIYRDLRDSIVSEYFHKFHFQRGMHHPELLDVEEELMFTPPYIVLWSGVLKNSRFSVIWKNSSLCTSVCYEEMMIDTEVNLKIILQSFDLSTHNELLKYIVYQNSFEVLSEGRKIGEENKKSFFRSGIVGGWKGYISESTSDFIINYSTLYQG